MSKTWRFLSCQISAYYKFFPGLHVFCRISTGLKWNHEASGIQLKVKSNKKRPPLIYSICLKLRVCKNFIIDIDRVSDDITMPIVWFVLQLMVKFAHLNQR